MSDNLEYIIPDVVYLDAEGRRVNLHLNPSPERAAALKFLSSPKFDKCKIDLFVMREGCRVLSSDEVTINCEPDETERG